MKTAKFEKLYNTLLEGRITESVEDILAALKARIQTVGEDGDEEGSIGESLVTESPEDVIEAIRKRIQVVGEDDSEDEENEESDLTSQEEEVVRHDKNSAKWAKRKERWNKVSKSRWL